MTENLDTMSGPDLIDHALEVDDVAVRDAALGRITDKANAIRTALDAGVSPAEFKRLESVQSALETAHTVVDVLWKSAKAKRDKGE